MPEKSIKMAFGCNLLNKSKNSPCWIDLMTQISAKSQLKSSFKTHFRDQDQAAFANISLQKSNQIHSAKIHIAGLLLSFKQRNWRGLSTRDGVFHVAVSPFNSNKSFHKNCKIIRKNNTSTTTLLVHSPAFTTATFKAAK